MKAILRSIVRKLMNRYDYAIIDLKKDQWPGMLLPGHLKKNLERLAINCVIDVGANRGDYAATLRGIGYAGRIVSVEPQSEVYSELTQRAASDSSWQTASFALGDKDEVRNFNVYAASTLNSFLKPTGNMTANVNDSYVTRVEPVAVKRLDSVFADIVRDIPDPRVFLKLDTQGYDLEVMKGAVQSLDYIFGIQSEISVIPLYEGMPDYIDALAYYRQLGFEPTGFFTVIPDRQTGHVLEFDAVFTRRQLPPSQAIEPASQD